MGNCIDLGGALDAPLFFEKRIAFFVIRCYFYFRWHNSNRNQDSLIREVTGERFSL